MLVILLDWDQAGMISGKPQDLFTDSPHFLDKGSELISKEMFSVMQ